ASSYFEPIITRVAMRRERAALTWDIPSNSAFAMAPRACTIGWEALVRTPYEFQPSQHGSPGRTGVRVLGHGSTASGRRPRGRRRPTRGSAGGAHDAGRKDRADVAIHVDGDAAFRR